jgi:hypothetical protein
MICSAAIAAERQSTVIAPESHRQPRGISGEMSRATDAATLTKNDKALFRN